jgi:DNA polymerase III delta subunit
MPQYAKASLGEFNASLKRATAAIYLLTGPRYFQERALRVVRATFPGGADSGAVIGLEEGKFDPVEFCDLARELPMFTPRRLLFALGLKDKDLKALAAQELGAADLFDSPNSKVTIVLGCAEGKALSAALYDADAVHRYDFAPVWPEKLPGFAQEAARELGFALTPALAQAVAEASGGEISLAAAEVEKLALSVKNGKLDEAEAMALIAAPEAAEYELATKIEEGKSGEALKLLAAELEGGTRPTELILAISGALGVLLAAKGSPDQLTAALGRRAFKARVIGPAARPLSAIRLRRALRELAGMELSTRFGDSGEAGLMMTLKSAMTPGR